MDPDPMLANLGFRSHVSIYGPPRSVILPFRSLSVTELSQAVEGSESFAQ